MGDLIKDNPFTASIIVTLLLIGIFSFTVGKAYVDKQDRQIENGTKETFIKYFEQIDSSVDSVKALQLEQLKLMKNGR